MQEILHVSQAMLQSIHEVFPPPTKTNHQGHDPIAEGKLQKLEGLWDYRKEILGWIFNGVHRSIELAPKKFTSLMNELRKAEKSTYMRIKEFQSLVGKLRHASFAIPATKGLFSPCNEALQHDPKRINVATNLNLQQAFKDYRALLREVQSRPTSIYEIYPTLAKYLGYVDASSHGAGGVWFSGTMALQPIVWQVEWPPEIKTKYKNKELSNSDLEMAALILQWLVLEYSVPTKHISVGVGSDNTPTVFWTRKFSAQRSRPASRLVRVLALRIKGEEAAPLLIDHIAGDLNTMADNASRGFSSNPDHEFAHISPPISFLQYFNSKFPLPQNLSWLEFQITQSLISKVTSELVQELSEMESWKNCVYTEEILEGLV